MKAFLLVTVLVFAFGMLGAQSVNQEAGEQSSVKLEKVYPNPMSDYVMVEMTAQEFVSANIVLMDVLGNPVQEWEKVEVTPGIQKIRLALNNLHSGIYLLKVKVGSQCFVIRLRKV